MKFSNIRLATLLFVLPLLLSAKNYGQATPAETALWIGLLLYLLLFVISFFASIINMSQPLKSIRNFNLIMCLPFIGFVALGLYVDIQISLFLGLILLLKVFFIYQSYTRTSALGRTEKINSDETTA